MSEPSSRPSADGAAADSFSAVLLAWWKRHGRHDLPWQATRDPYRVWLAEIMLQQTRVSTALGYYAKFLAAFPTVAALAEASRNQVMLHWAGLGYYRRAANLHRTAQILVREHRGKLPCDLEQLQRLPGIGRSTAGAILAAGFDVRGVLLDGNARRVLARCHLVEGWHGSARTAKTLWRLAEMHTPHSRCRDYNQAIMDLGATVCTRSAPRCGDCPLQNSCLAARRGLQREYPQARPARRPLPERAVQMLLIAAQDGRALLVRRPPGGVWGDLWCLPEIALHDDPVRYCRETLRIEARLHGGALPERSHSFTHFRLRIVPTPLAVVSGAPNNQNGQIEEVSQRRWEPLAGPLTVGVAAPVKELLREWSALRQARKT